MIATFPTDDIKNLRQQEFRKQLNGRVMVADGAMGTVLYSKGVFINRCFDELNLSAPALVKETHQEYVRAGAEILETNTFGANRIRLAAFGLAEKLRAIITDASTSPLVLREIITGVLRALFTRAKLPDLSWTEGCGSVIRAEGNAA